MAVKPTDLVAAADAATDVLATALDGDRDWDARPPGLDWTARDTLDHVVTVLVFYSAQLAARASERLAYLRRSDPAAKPPHLVSALGTAARLLADVATAAGPGARAWHPLGVADSEGFLAMGCDEILVHTADVAAALGVPFQAPARVCEQALARLFPWVTVDGEPWATLLWANDRADLPDRPRPGAGWAWWCAPLSEWDGTPAGSSPVTAGRPGG